jgi:soluble lytic murein transglycosylase-like protein
MLESSYNSNAISPANAAGLWQLMPATAKRFGLQVSDTRDERFDIKISTQAAIAYLTFLYKKFNQDITLTLAAYNAGEGRVARAIKGAGSREFKHLTLPKETQHYVKRFYALQQLVNVQQLVNTQQDLAKPPASLLLFSSQPKFSHQPIINFRRLPSLIKLGLVK